MPGHIPEESVIVTTAPSRSGKSYSRCACFGSECFLPGGRGWWWSNFPINIEEMIEYVIAWHGGDADDLRERIVLFPPQIIAAWRNGESGPWEWFACYDEADFDYNRENNAMWAGYWFPDRITEVTDTAGRTVYGLDLTGHYISIDEAHKYCGKYSDRGRKIKHAKSTGDTRVSHWQDFMGEIGHRGAKIEFITQAPQKLHAAIHQESAMRIVLVNSDSTRDPFFKILRKDWRNLACGFFGWAGVRYRPLVWETESMAVDKKEVVVHESAWRIDPSRFHLYNSYSAPESGGLAANEDVQPKEFERRNALSLLLWFVGRNAQQLATRGAFIVALYWLTLGGGLGSVVGGIFSAVGHISLFGSKKPGAAAVAAAPAKQIEVDEVKEADYAIHRVRELSDGAAPKSQLVTTSATVAAAPVIKPVMIFKGKAVLSDGRTIRTGEPLEGKEVVVDQPGRRVLVGGVSYDL